jgi:hypothetical protein
MNNKKQPTKSKRTRAKNAGKNRQELYRKAHGRIKAAKAHGYYLECIALIESMIADQLESLLAKQYPVGEERLTDFACLERLCKKNKYTNLPSDLESCLDDVLLWADCRNTALHEMVKLSENNLQTWEDKQSKAKAAIPKGLTLLKQLSSIVRREKKKADQINNI